ncbi:MAG: hypothetical protein AAAFM81_03425 [Pseudomonadota bacterium]
MSRSERSCQSQSNASQLTYSQLTPNEQGVTGAVLMTVGVIEACQRLMTDIKYPALFDVIDVWKVFVLQQQR